MEDQYIGKYVFFDGDNGRFCLSEEALETIYHEKEVICSYSGANEWCNHFICELIDLYSGGSKYNYALGTVVHEKEIPRIWAENPEAVERWLLKAQKSDWFKELIKVFDFTFEKMPDKTYS